MKPLVVRSPFPRPRDGKAITSAEVGAVAFCGGHRLVLWRVMSIRAVLALCVAAIDAGALVDTFHFPDGR